MSSVSHPKLFQCWPFLEKIFLRRRKHLSYILVIYLNVLMLKLSKKSMVTGDFFLRNEQKNLFTKPFPKLLNLSFHKQSQNNFNESEFFLFQKLCFINLKGKLHYLRLIYVPFSEKLPAQL